MKPKPLPAPPAIGVNGRLRVLVVKVEADECNGESEVGTCAMGVSVRRR